MAVSVDGYRRRFGYEDWADREVLAGLRTMDPLTERSRRWLGHIVGTQEVWLDRLKGEGLVSDAWPDLGLEEMEGRLEGLRGAWGMYLDGLGESGLSGEVGYRTSKGEAWSSGVGDILEHVLLHGAYHRGQIASEVRREGGEPASTDYIFAVRGGWFEGA